LKFLPIFNLFKYVKFDSDVKSVILLPYKSTSSKAVKYCNASIFDIPLTLALKLFIFSTSALIMGPIFLPTISRTTFSRFKSLKCTSSSALGVAVGCVMCGKVSVATGVGMITVGGATTTSVFSQHEKSIAALNANNDIIIIFPHLFLLIILYPPL
jgi:hypothetical protein